MHVCVHSTSSIESGFCDYTNETNAIGTYVWPETAVNAPPVTMNCTNNAPLLKKGDKCLKVGQGESPSAVASRSCGGAHLWNTTVGPGCVTTVTYSFRLIGDRDCGAVRKGETLVVRLLIAIAILYNTPETDFRHRCSNS